MSKKISKKKTIANYSYYWITQDGRYGWSRSQEWKGLWPSHSFKQVWRQGPKGGVKVVHDTEFARYEYITQQSQAMAEFEQAKTFALLSS